MRTALIVLLSLNLLGCTAVRFSTDRPSYTSGDSVTLRLLNQGVTTVGYNLGCSMLERQTELAWEPYPWPEWSEERECLAILYQVRAFGEDTGVQQLPAGEIGTFRYATGVDANGTSRMVTTDPFTVTP